MQDSVSLARARHHHLGEIYWKSCTLLTNVTSTTGNENSLV